ncbi:2'-5' RNA ligase [Corynebacterium sanguinis]|uniref:2'-5' RNA ligase n=1 Tax=Corynebacterium sanguinis TaxID=2594913 RepID=UPI00264BC65D|nr:2'-5' RNA ligase [Corynebacterium sanguinis]MDN8622459.1 2'-5' RNA ligase [Corynebacterium sanguinis]
MSPENILLRLPREQESQVGAIYTELARRGFPEQSQRPHVSVTFAPTMDRRVVGEAAVVLPPLLPARMERVGTVVFGTKSKQTVAWLLEASDELEVAARRVSAMNPDGRGPRWIPHLTMGLRIPKAIVPGYIEALAEATSPHLTSITAQRAAFYQPGLGAELVL